MKSERKERVMGKERAGSSEREAEKRYRQ